MLKKSISGILVLLIFINSIGCYSYKKINMYEINMYDTERIEKGEKFRITTLEGTVYYLTNVEVQESIVRGKGKVIKQHLVYLGGAVEIRFEDIKSIEVEEIDVKTLLLIVLGASVIVLTVFFVIMIDQYVIK